MCGATGEGGVVHSSRPILSENDGNRGQAHKRSISIIQPISLLAIILSSVHELIHRDLDVAAEADRLFPAAVVEAIEEP